MYLPGGAGQAGGQDFSQQWIDYYRQMGDHEKAAAIEQSLKARVRVNLVISFSLTISWVLNVVFSPFLSVQTAADPHQGSAPSMPSGGAPAGGDASGKADYTAQWIAYYRANGMNKEADAIEQSLKARVGNDDHFGGGGEGVGDGGGGFGGNGLDPQAPELYSSDSSGSTRSSGFFSDSIYKNM